jgi:hypothetical protein
MKKLKVKNSGNLVGAGVCIQTKTTSFWGKYLGPASIQVNSQFSQNRAGRGLGTYSSFGHINVSNE